MSKKHISNPKPSTGDGMTQKINREVAYRKNLSKIVRRQVEK